MTAPALLPSREADLAARWAAGIGGPLRLEDGRTARVVFPGVPTGGSGPDFRDAMLEVEGDLLRGDVEIHLLASGWRSHGHGRDPAYGAIILHVVGQNDDPGALTAHASGRLIPILVLPARASAAPAFTPPCVFASASGLDPGPALDRMGLRRLRIKAARAGPLVAAHGAGQALYALLLETLGGPPNREPFAALARRLPLAALLELADGSDAPRALALTSHLKGAAASLSLRRAGLRPMASPARRLESAGAILNRLWPPGAGPGWPAALAPGVDLRALRGGPAGRALGIECLVNAVIPVALATGEWTEAAVHQAFLALPSPGTYGRLKPLERWLASGGARPFPGAARLQGGLLLHADYCSRGKCGQCPLSS